MRKLKGNWTDIFNGFSVALDIKKMFVGFIGMFFTLVIVGLIPVMVGGYVNPYTKEIINPCLRYEGAMAAIMAGTSWKVGLLFAGIALLLILVWSYLGGIISRIAAVNITKDEGLDLKKAISFANKKYVSLFSPFILAVLGFLFFAVCNLLGGLVGRIPFVGELLVALLLPLAIISGFIMVFILIGFIFGRMFFIPTIAVESSDAFDAVSRSFQYLYAEPWHYIWYMMVSIFYGIITTAFVWFFGGLMIVVSLVTVKLGMGLKLASILAMTGLHNCGQIPASAPVTYNIAAYVIMVWLVLIVGMLLAYIVSYCWSACTIVYLLMRKKVDDIEMTELYEEEPAGDLAAAPEAPKTENPATPSST
ncbi:MAG TPA: hypothetical protein VJC37_04900 [Planctomycetota bacterium]|nr:hypothetical protein [Planctomycetota bacterium]